MSVRTEPRDLSSQLQQTLTITPEMMAAQNPAVSTAMMPAPTAGTMEAQGNEQHLHEANTFNTNNEHHPLERTVCVNIRASLSDLCLKSQSATWAPPSAEATKAIFQQARPNKPHSNRSHRPHRPQAARRARRRPYRLISSSLAQRPTNQPTRHTPIRTLC